MKINKKFVIRDITPSYKITISETHIISLDNVILKLDNQNILNLDIKFWDEKSIVDLYENKINYVMYNL